MSKQSHKSFEDAERKGKCSRQCEEMKEKNWFHSSRFVSIFICDMERIFEFISMFCLRNRVVIPMYVNERKHCRYLPDICWIFANISSSGQSFLIFHFHSYFCFCCCCCKQRSTRWFCAWKINLQIFIKWLLNLRVKSDMLSSF